MEPKEFAQRDGEEAITLTLDPQQISRDASLRAAYWFTGHLNIEFPPSPAGLRYSVVLRPKPLTLEVPKRPAFPELVADFQNALIDSELRVRVQQETSAVRELILAKAFAEAGVLEDLPVGSFNDPVLSEADQAQSATAKQQPDGTDG